jgi:hypothetical protein
MPDKANAALRALVAGPLRTPAFDWGLSSNRRVNDPDPCGAKL